MTCDDVVLLFDDARVAHHFGEHVGRRRHGHERIGVGRRPHAERGERGVGVDLAHAVFGVGVEDLGGDVVGVVDRACEVLDAALTAVEVGLQGGEVVARDAREHARDHLVFADGALPVGFIGLPAFVFRLGARVVVGARDAADHHGRHVESRAHDLQGIDRKRVFLD